MNQTSRNRIIELASRCGITDDYQHRLIFEEGRNVIVNKARATGISTVECFRRLMKAIAPKIWELPQKEQLMLSASEPQAKHLMSYVHEFWNMIRDRVPEIKLKVDKESEMSWDNGNRIFSLPCSSKATRTYHGDITLDEYAHFEAGEDYKMYTALSGITALGGELRIISTPNGEQGKFYDIWADDRGVFKKISLPHTKCRRPVYRKYVAQQRKKMLAIEFEQEFMCRFISEQTRPLPLDIILGCVDKKLKINEHTEHGPLYNGTDFAKMVDETCIVLLERLDNGVLRVYWMECFAKMDYSEQLDYIERLYNQSRFLKAHVDKTGVGIMLHEDLEKRVGSRVEGITFTNPIKEKLFQQIKNALLDNKLILPNNKKLIEQIHQLQRRITPGGAIQYGHPKGKKDDMFWALALAIDAANGESFVPLETRVGGKLVISDLGLGNGEGKIINRKLEPNGSWIREAWR